MLYYRYLRDQRVCCQELFAKDIITKHAPHLQGVTRHFDSPMDETAKFSVDQCPAENSPEREQMRDKQSMYSTVIGALLYLVACTRPDLANAVSILARFVSNPALVHYQALQRVLVYLRDTTHAELSYSCTDDPFVIYSDANWSDKVSTSGAVFFLFGCPFAWYSRLQRSISHSSAEAEFIGASMAAREGMFHRDVLVDVDELTCGPTVLYLDSKSAIDLTFDAVAFKKTKHVLRDANFLRDVVARLFFKPEHVVSESMLADMLTKPLPRPQFVAQRQLLRVLIDVSASAGRQSRRG